MRVLVSAIMLAAVLMSTPGARADFIDVFDLWLAMNATDTRISGGSGFSRIEEEIVFGGPGFLKELSDPATQLGVTFNNNLVSGTGDFSWVIENQGADITNVSLLLFANLDVIGLDSFSEHLDDESSLVSLSLPTGAPAGAIAAINWEIDDPFFGNVIGNVDFNTLDNSTFLFPRDDASLAFGFDFALFPAGGTVTASFFIGTDSAIGGISINDTEDGFAQDPYFINGYLTVAAAEVPVPEPATVVLFLTGLLGMGIVSRKRKR